MAITGANVDFVRGDGLTVPHVLQADAAGGTVLVVGNTPFILSGSGGKSGDTVGVYTGDGTNTFRGVVGGDVVGGGLKLFWDDTAKKLLGGNGGAGNKHIGRTLPDQGATADTNEIEFIYEPDGSEGTA